MGAYRYLGTYTCAMLLFWAGVRAQTFWNAWTLHRPCQLRGFVAYTCIVQSRKCGLSWNKGDRTVKLQHWTSQALSLLIQCKFIGVHGYTLSHFKILPIYFKKLGRTLNEEACIHVCALHVYNTVYHLLVLFVACMKLQHTHHCTYLKSSGYVSPCKVNPKDVQELQEGWRESTGTACTKKKVMHQLWLSRSWLSCCYDRYMYVSILYTVSMLYVIITCTRVHLHESPKQGSCYHSYRISRNNYASKSLREARCYINCAPKIAYVHRACICRCMCKNFA